MNKHLGRATYAFFILLFFIITPILITYSLGYRYNFTSHTIEKRGAFYVKSYPRGADIFVDNKKVRQKTPTQLTNVSSGLYSLTVAKDKYVPWQKKLNINPGETTFAEDIVLFLENRPKTSLGEGGDQAIVNKAQDQYAYIGKDNTLNITDITLEKTWPVYKLPKKTSLLDWSADNQRLLLNDDVNFFIFDINRKELNKLPLTGIKKISWDDSTGNLLWYTKNQALYQYILNTTGNDNKKIDLPYPVTDFDTKDNWLLVEHAQADQNFVSQLNIQDFSIKQVIDRVNNGPLSLLLINNQELIFSAGSQLYIKTENQDLISIPFNNAKIHDQRLLLSNGYEIILYNFKEHWQVLIDRSSQIVTDVLWHPNGSYFLSESNNSTQLAEIDGRDVRNSIELLNDAHKKFYLFDKKGDKLFVLTPEENFYLTIQ